MDQLLEIPNISRIMIRLLLKIDRTNSIKSEILPYAQGERSFDDLLSHADKIEEDDECALQIFETVMSMIPSSVQSWQYFKEAYGRLIINSFEVSGDDEEKVGWALYLGPSILGLYINNRCCNLTFRTMITLDHSCVPNAEVDFQGKRIIVKSKTNTTDVDLRKIYISYIDIGAPSDVRRRKLKKFYHFDCFCDRCVGIKLSWVISEPFNENLSDILLQRKSIVEAIEANGKGKDKVYFSSMRCQKCTGRPVQVIEERNGSVCSFCNQVADADTVNEYLEVKEAVKKVLHMEQIPADAAPQCMELMTGKQKVILNKICIGLKLIIELLP